MMMMMMMCGGFFFSGMGEIIEEVIPFVPVLSSIITTTTSLWQGFIKLSNRFDQVARGYFYAVCLPFTKKVE